VADHQILVIGPGSAQFGEHLLCALPQALVIEVIGVDQARLDPCLRGLQARGQPLVERTGRHRYGMQAPQRIGQQFHQALGRKLRRRGQVAAGQRAHQQPAPARFFGGGNYRWCRLALRLQPAQARDLIAQLTEGIDHFRFQEGISLSRAMHTGDVCARYADRLSLDARIGQCFRHAHGSGMPSVKGSGASMRGCSCCR
jgi:hypothetical protein